MTSNAQGGSLIPPEPTVFPGGGTFLIQWKVGGVLIENVSLELTENMVKACLRWFSLGRTHNQISAHAPQLFLGWVAEGSVRYRHGEWYVHIPSVPPGGVPTKPHHSSLFGGSLKKFKDTWDEQIASSKPFHSFKVGAAKHHPPKPSMGMDPLIKSYAQGLSPKVKALSSHLQGIGADFAMMPLYGMPPGPINPLTKESLTALLKEKLPVGHEVKSVTMPSPGVVNVEITAVVPIDEIELSFVLSDVKKKLPVGISLEQHTKQLPPVATDYTPAE